jgi:glycerophosphoryl diester phosphodiesterase
VRKDGSFVIIHDDNTKRVSGIDIDVESAEYADLKDIRLKDTLDKKTRSDLAIPTLSEYIRICKKYEKMAVLELKNLMEKKDINKIIGIIDKLGYLKNTIFISFEMDNLKAVKETDSTLKVQYLANKWNDNLPQVLKDNGMDLDIKFTQLNKQRVKLLHQNGIKVNTWTVNTTEDARRLTGFGVDYITTNILE